MAEDSSDVAKPTGPFLLPEPAQNSNRARRCEPLWRGKRRLARSSPPLAAPRRWANAALAAGVVELFYFRGGEGAVVDAQIIEKAEVRRGEHAESRLFVLNKNALTVLPDRGLTDHCFLLSGTPKKTIEERLEEVIDNG